MRACKMISVAKQKMFRFHVNFPGRTCHNHAEKWDVSVGTFQSIFTSMIMGERVRTPHNFMGCHQRVAASPSYIHALSHLSCGLVHVKKTCILLIH